MMTLAAPDRLPARSLPMTVIVLLIYIGVATWTALGYAEVPHAVIHISGAVAAGCCLIQAVSLATERGRWERQVYGPSEPSIAELDDEEEEW